MGRTGNSKSVFAIMGASNHSETERQKNDYYATEPLAVELLLAKEKFSRRVLEPACGEGHISKVLKRHGYDVISSDVIDYGFGGVQNFFNISSWGGDIITNPPYKLAKEFVQHALEIIPAGRRVAMFLKLTFLESKERQSLFKENPPRFVYVAVKRLQCAKNGDFEKFGAGVGTAICYAWFIWEKGFKGEPVIRWIGGESDEVNLFEVQNE